MNRVLLRKLLPAGVAVAIVAGCGPLIRPVGTMETARDTRILSGAEIDSQTLAIIGRACRDCHSLNTVLPFYGHFAPFSWLIARDVQQARLHMNLSQWQEYSAADRARLLSEIGGAVRKRQMPVQRYLLLHREARLSDQEREKVYQWTRAERSRLRSQQTQSELDSSSP